MGRLICTLMDPDGNPIEAQVFDHLSTRYDQETYYGRLQTILTIIDPRNLLVSDAELKRCQDLLTADKSGSRAINVTDDDLWCAKAKVDAIIHPVSGEKIPAPLRMAGFVPVQLPIIFGMLNMPSMGAQLGWQWINQTYNSAQNYANRSGGEMSMQEIGTAYALAIGVSMGSAAAIKKAVTKLKPGTIIQRIAVQPWCVPYVAVAAAGSANVYFTRRPEILNGVPITDKEGNHVGISRAAAKQGVGLTILSRSCGLPLPVLVFPALIMQVIPKKVPMRTPIELGVILASVAIALPAALAIFPQQMKLNAKTLEPEFHHLGTVYCNKGL